MSTVIRKLAWSRLANPRVAVTVAGLGLLLGIIVGATAPNTATLQIKLPLSHLLPSLHHYNALTLTILITGDILACLGLAGMLWAHSQGWRPNARHLLLVSAAVVAVMVSLTPVGSSDTASYAAFGRITAQAAIRTRKARMRGCSGIRPSCPTTRSSARYGRASRPSTARSPPGSRDSRPRSAERTSSPPSGS